MSPEQVIHFVSVCVCMRGGGGGVMSNSLIFKSFYLFNLQCTCSEMPVLDSVARMLGL